MDGTQGQVERALLEVLLVGLAGAFIVRLRAAGMARTLIAMAFTQGAIAVLAGWGMP